MPPNWLMEAVSLPQLHVECVVHAVANLLDDAELADFFSLCLSYSTAVGKSACLACYPDRNLLFWHFVGWMLSLRQVHCPA